MVPSVIAINDMLNTLAEEDYEMAISYIQFLSESRKKEKVKKATKVMDEFQTILGGDTGWSSEEEMLADMAKFRKERMGL